MKLKVFLQYLMAFLPFLILTGLVSCKKDENALENADITPFF